MIDCLPFSPWHFMPWEHSPPVHDEIPAALKRDADNIAPWMRDLEIKPKEPPKPEFPWSAEK